MERAHGDPKRADKKEKTPAMGLWNKSFVGKIEGK